MTIRQLALVTVCVILAIFAFWFGLAFLIVKFIKFAWGA